MQIRNYLALIITFVSAYSFAADNMQMFNSKSECLRSFTISSGTSDVVAGENYCKNRVVKSAVELCADKKLLEFKMKNSISSVQEQQYLFKFKTECTQASLSAATGGQQSQQSTQLSERDAQISAQQAAMNTQQQAALAAATAQKNQAAALAQQKEDAARQVALTKALVPVLNQVASDYDKQAAIEAKEAREAAGKSAPAEKPAVATAAAPAKESPPEAAPPVAAPVAAQADAAPADGVLTEGVYKDAAGHSYQVVDNLSEPSKPLIMKTDAKTGAQTEVADPRTDGVPLTSDGAEVVRDVGTGLSEPIAEATKAAAIPSSADGGESVISTAAVAKTAEEKSEVAMTITQTNTLLRTYVYATKEAFHFTPTKLEAFKAKFEAFASGPKPTCVKLAETSSFLCVEAPGAKTAKTLMDAAGPILAAVSSVQKACSNTAKVTNFASKLMTIAKATCVAAKLACDAGCGAASASVKGLLAELKTIEASVSSDQAQASGQCEMECESRAASQCSATTIGFMACYTPALAACNTPCQADVTKKTADAKAALQKITASISKENVPTPAGSVAATQVQCNMNAKDIVGLALNALSLANARESAKECDRKMASTGTGGGPVTPQQYCEIPANSGTQFCKCQQNSKQEGCPGNTGTGSLVSKDADKSNVAGVNLKTGAGLSGFAGGTRGNPILNGGRGSNGQGSGSGGGTNADGVKLGLGGDTTGGSGAGGGVAGGGAHGGGNSGGGAADSNGGGAPEKKWSFGSFANALGGMFGGGGGGKGGKDSKNGNLNSKQQEAIKRKLASDKLAGEITSASGKSNWEKVHQTYLIKDNSLLTGN